ncbi:choice-of-anchor L domain-containing protein [Polyangium aurulentum]|nr:choice-of-anchor L domain-containing protein [Polyangium aurulentum]
MALSAGCKITTDPRTFGGGEGGAGGEWTSGAGKPDQGGSGASDGIGGGFDPSTGSGGSTGSGSSSCMNDKSVDDDGDGSSEAQGDCNDCDKNVGPGAVEVINADPMAQASDEDCDGNVDNVLNTTCDDNIALTDPDPKNGARAIDLCQFVDPADKKWGVLEARYVRASGVEAAYKSAIGILSDFGPNVNVQKGTRMLALSSGYSRLAAQPGACGQSSCNTYGAGSPPGGFPQDVPNCPGSKNINDDIGLEVKIRAPKNATGYKFNFKFYSFEYPEYVCTSFNDQFIALVNPAPMGSINGNISFDSKKNPVSVNVAFFDVCDGCPLGASEMDGTGFNVWNDAGGTAWLATQAPINGGEEFSVRFAIWDTGDSALDSTAVIDGFEWIANGGTVSVGTDTVPTPK